MAKEKLSERKLRALEIVTRLTREYPDSRSALDYEDPLQCLIATVLSAQCTDAQVNKVTPALFRRYPEAKDFAGADISVLEQDIRSTGFYKNKAKSIKACAIALVANFGGRVPESMEELLTLSGVGRKTANCVIGNAYRPARGHGGYACQARGIPIDADGTD